MKFLITPVVALLLVLSGCGANQPSLSQLANDETREKLTEELAAQWSFVLDHNDSCYFNFTGPGIPDSKECEAFLNDFQGWINRVVNYINDRVNLAIEGMTDLEEIDTTVRRIWIEAVTEITVGAQARFPAPVEENTARFLDIISRSTFANPEVVRPAAFMHFYYLQPLFSNEKLTDLLFNLEYDHSKVAYDGETATLSFSDVDLETDINYLAMSLIYAANNFKIHYDRLSVERKKFWTTNDNTVGGSSRVEPFDLLVVRSKNLQKYRVWEFNEYDLNPIEMGRVVSRAIDRLLDINRPNPYHNLYVFRKHGDGFSEDSILSCAGTESLETGHGDEFSKMPGSGFFIEGMQSVQFAELDDSQLEKLREGKQIRCAGKTYSYKARALGGDQIITRPEMNFDDEIKVLFTTALIREMNKEAMAGAIVYLQSKGYWIKPAIGDGLRLWRVVDDVKADYLQEASDADIMIPVSHTANMVQVDLGTKSGLKIVAQKYVRRDDGGHTNLKLVFYTPPFYEGSGNFNMASLKTEDLEKLFLERRADGKQSAMVMNVSCFSRKTLDIWMRAYRMSIPDSGETIVDFGDAPIVIASKAGFATKETTQILSHFEYPLGVIDRVAKGSPMKAILEFLNSKPKTPQRAALAFIQKIMKITSNKELRHRIVDPNFWREPPDDFSETFAPVTNLEIEHFWDGTERIDMIFQNVNDPDDHRVF